MTGVHLSSPPTSSRAVTPVLPSYHREHQLEWLCRYNWYSWKGEDHQYGDYVTEVLVRWVRNISRMGNYCLSRIKPWKKLYPGYRDRRAIKKRFKDSLKKFFGASHINHRRWSTTPGISSYENNHKATLNEKKAWEEEQQYSTNKLWTYLLLQLCMRVLH